MIDEIKEMINNSKEYLILMKESQIIKQVMSAAMLVGIFLFIIFMVMLIRRCIIQYNFSKRQAKDSDIVQDVTAEYGIGNDNSILKKNNKKELAKQSQNIVLAHADSDTIYIEKEELRKQISKVTPNLGQVVSNMFKFMNKEKS